MAPCSEYSADDIVGVWPLMINSNETPSQPTPDRGIDPSVITGWGALFSESPDSRPAQLDPRDVEDIVDSNQPQADAEAEQAADRPPLSTGPLPSRGTASAMTYSSPVMEYYHTNPYMSLSELEELRRQRSARTVRATDARSSSSQGTRNSEYLSARDCSSSSPTEGTQEEDAEGSPLERPPTPYFTPSHTPSHRSVGTATEDLENEGRAPDSPHPRSNFYPYDAKYGLTAVNRVD